MTITFSCPLCESKFQVPDEWAGKSANCKKCQAKLTVPDAPPGARAPVPERLKKVAGAFQGEIERVRTSLAYRLSLALVALFMILLPLVYVLLIVLVACVVVYHLTHHGGMVGAAPTGRLTVFAAILYAAPAVIGGIIVIFMFKPLFAQRANVRRSRSLTRKGEPILFAFVDKIAEAVGAPIPQRINVDSNVNASASFKDGAMSLFKRGDLTLTIGLPLVAGLNSRQFAGVLAHELGHFSQGAGMRLTYIIWAINAWFSRVVYERDKWDVMLEEASEEADFRIGWILIVARGGVWLSRQVLWLLMVMGHIVSGALLRQMEFDADRYEARIAGSDAFEGTTRRLAELGAASQQSFGELIVFLSRGHLGDNFPKLVVRNASQLTSKLRKSISERLKESKVSAFATHPPDALRVKNAQQLKAPGVFHIEAPASDLFVHFDATCKNVTLDLYRDLTGAMLDPNKLESFETLLAAD